MESKYIFPASRVKTLSYELLSENQLERLLGSKGLEETFKVLQDTFLESFVYSKVQDISKPMENTILQAKTLLSKIAPDKRLISMLWLEFDFFNLKIITKGKIKNWSFEEIKKHGTFPGEYSFENLYKAYEEKKLGSLNKFFEQAVNKATESKEGVNIDIIFDQKYLENLKDLSKKLKVKFVKNFVSKVIDLYNTKAALRVFRLKDQGVEIVIPHVSGGKISRKELEDKSKVLDIFKKFGNGNKWREALEEHQKTGNFSQIEKASEAHLLEFLKRESFDLFTPATLFAYFYRLKNNLQIIRAIVLGKKMGLKELEIRTYMKELH